MDARIVSDLDELQEHTSAWDGLAVGQGLPYCSPHWMLAWWRHRAAVNSELRVAVATDGGKLVGVFPWYREGAPARVGVWRQLCAGDSVRIGPLVAPGREADVAGVVAPLLADGSGPDILTLEALPGGSPWPAAFRTPWTGRLPPLIRHDLSMPAPVALLAGSFEDWLARRGRTVRREIPRRRRRLLEQGVSIRMAGDHELEWAVRQLCDLYRGRWEWRGGSEFFTPGLEKWLVDAARALGDRFQLWLLDREGGPVGAYLFVRAGSHLTDWGGGFLADWARFSPTYVLRLTALEHAAETEVMQVDFAEGAQRDKLHFADDELLVEWVTLLPRGKGYLEARARLLPQHIRGHLRGISRRLPTPVRERLRRVAGRAGYA